MNTSLRTYLYFYKSFYVLLKNYLLLLSLGIVATPTFCLAQSPITNTGNLTVSLGGMAAYFGHFTNAGSGVMTNNGTIFYWDDLTNNGNYTSNGLEVFQGTSAQLIDGSMLLDLNNVQLDNANGLTIDNEVQVKGTFTFINGIVTTDRSDLADQLHFTTSGAYTDQTDARHVDGYACKTGTTGFAFPVGDNGVLRPISISGSAASSKLCAAYFNVNPNAATLPTGAPFSTAALGAGLSSVSTVEYWDVDGTANVNLILTWNAASMVGSLAGSLSNLRVVGWDGAQWVDLGNVATTGDLTNGSITSNAIIPNSYEAFTIGSVSGCPNITAVLAGSASICLGQSTDLTVTITGGVGTYTVVLNDGSNNITVNNYNSGDPIVVSSSTATSYILVSITDANTCPGTSLSGTATVTVETVSVPFAFAGFDAKILDDETYTISNAVATNGTILWTTSGDGTFDDATIQNPTYTPGTNDITAGTVTLTLTVTGTGACATVMKTDDMVLDIFPKCLPNAFDAANYGDMAVAGSALFQGNFTNAASGTITNDGTIHYIKDLTNNGSYTSPTGIDIFEGCQLQTVDGTTELAMNDVELDNADGLVVANELRVANQFTFTDGIASTDRSNLAYQVHFLDNAIYTNQADARHVDGYVFKTGNDVFTFPIGSGTALRTASISAPTNVTDEFAAAYLSGDPSLAAYPSGGPFDTNSKDIEVLSVSTIEHWDVNGATAVNLTLTWNTASMISTLTSDLKNLIIVGWDGTKWVNLGNTATTGDLMNGSITSQSLIPDTYTAFTLAALDPQAPGCADKDNVLVWLRGDKNATSSLWKDFSGRFYDATQGTAGNQPATGGLVNFNHALDFAGDDFFDINLDIDPAATDPITVLMVYQADATGRPLWGNESGAEDRYLSMTDVATGTGATPYTNGDVTNQAKLLTVSMDATDQPNGNNTNSYVYVDGVLNTTFSQSSASGTFDQTRLGRITTATSNLFDGRIAEFVIYNSELSSADRQKAESYLAIKYGITLDQSPSQNYFASDGTTIFWDATTNGSYKNHIAGIGRDDCTTLNQKQSRSANGNGIVTMGLGSIAVDNVSNANGFSADYHFMMWARNLSILPVEQDLATSATNLPISLQGNTKRLDAGWRIDETGIVGNVQVQLDLTSVSVSATSINYIKLLIDRDGDGNFTTGMVDVIDAASFTAGMSVVFDNVNFEDGDIFTLASLIPEITLTATVMLQGPYNSGSMTTTLNSLNLIPLTDPYGLSTTTVSIPSGVTDWIKIEVRDKTYPNNILKEVAAFVKSDGSVVDVDGNTPVNLGMLPDIYRIAIRHRNHLGVMTNTNVDFTNSMATATLDFHDSNAPNYVATYGIYAQAEVETGKYALWAGDANRDGTVKDNEIPSDAQLVKDEVISHPNNPFPGAPPFIPKTNTFIITNVYNNHDVNLDGSVKDNETPSDAQLIKSIILGHPNNPFPGAPPFIPKTNTFIIMAQLP